MRICPELFPDRNSELILEESENKAGDFGAAGTIAKLTDAGVEACWELAWLAQQGPEPPSPPSTVKLAPARTYLARIVAAPPSPWTARAREQLRRLTAATQPKGTP